MRKDITLVGEPRETRGKNASRRLRVEHKSPAVLYGEGGDPVALTISPKEVTKILNSSSSYNTIFNLDVQGQVTPVMIQDWQSHPVKGNLLHVDLRRVDLTKKIVAKVPVHTTGDPFGVKVQGGHFEMVNREVLIEVLPDDIPERFTLDVSAMRLSESLRGKDIALTGSMRLVSDPELVVAHVVALRDSNADAGAEGAAEPEVAKKGKKEDPAAKAPAKAAAPAKKK